MMWQIFLIAGAVISSSDGCSRLCPCRREIDNITQRLDSLGEIEESFISDLMGTLRKINNNVYQLMQVAASNKNTSKVLTHLSEKVQDMIVEIQDIKGDSECTDDSETEDSPKQCPPHWVSFGGSCYYFQLHKARLTQDQANIQCESRYNGSSLVAIETLEEFNFLKEYLSKQYTSIRSTTTNGWLIAGKKVEGQWKWESTGAPLNFTAVTWGTGEPSGQTCLALYPSKQFNLADVFCSSYERQFICEI